VNIRVHGSGYYEDIYSGGKINVYSGGFDIDPVIYAGAVESVLSGGESEYAAVESGGKLNDKGLAYETTIYKGGTQTILSGGVDDYAQVYGIEKISAGGLGYGDTVYSGGHEYDYVNGVTSGAVISKGGTLTVSSGGTVTAATLRGGTLTELANGKMSGGLTISSGTANISGTVASGQEILFSGPGDLALYNLAGFHATIGGFSTGDKFDLGGFGYTTSETEVFSAGTLTVTDGAQVAKLTLLGSYVTSDFALSTDNHGGTFVKFV
jgi:antigen 43